MCISQKIYFAFSFHFLKIFIKIIFKLQKYARIKIVQRTLICFTQACLLLTFCPVCFHISLSFSIYLLLSLFHGMCGCMCSFFLKKLKQLHRSCPLTNEYLHIHLLQIRVLFSYIITKQLSLSKF